MRPGLDLSVYLVTDRPLCLGRDLEWVVAEAVAGGASLVQLREKDCPVREFVDLARSLVNLLAPLGVPLLVNDRVDVALASGAAGAHLGQTDMDPSEARRVLGPDAVIGLSVETMDQARTAEAPDGPDVDYYGVSPIFATSTKTDTGTPWGLDGLARLRAMTKRPLAAIGGIGPDNAAAVARAGADGVAVVSAICSADSPRDAASRLLKAVGQGRATP